MGGFLWRVSQRVSQRVSLEGFPRTTYVRYEVVVEAEQGTTGASGGNIITGTYNYGLNAQNHYNYGGGGGWTDGGQGYRANTSGSQYNGGNGTVPNYDRRSSGGGGGGAGYYGGGGGAEVNTSDGERGSPGGGSGSSYYSNSYPYNASFNYLSATTNTNAKITIKNKKTNASTTWTFSGLSDENTISLP